ncbi:uncharacterized protein NESG_02151 [Nematocida ausubeli]|uniref:Peptidase M16 N-terminal domain-containing protein n=1 Tax=Nematocida ausubeli (strain ATCC PRA-371 / ERTm2) TaxID=1913371 RepID=A0A086IZQ9_NEMA1|nr:uncharacterized protein NESG_02151 [Nematocida ausubeli]KAI5135723.1 hypothetical protein NEAUS07_1308 [Nematocida ausubeli]KFG25377.1 hypothetical protein NESG_02151 [Nematocida ausubeli]
MLSEAPSSIHPILKTVLPNGLSILLKPMAVEGSLVGLVIKGGSIENRRQGYPDGTAHLLEHALIDQISPRIREELHINGKTSNTHVSIYGYSLQSKSNEIVQELLSTVNKPVTEKNITEEMPRILREIEQVRETSSDHKEKFISAVQKDTAIHNSTILGTEKTLQHVTKGHLQKFLNSTLIPGNVLLVGIGNLDIPEILKTANSFQIPKLVPCKDSAASDAQIPGESTKEPINKVQNRSSHGEILVGYKIPWKRDIKAYAAYLAISYSIQKNLDPELKIVPHLSYTQEGGLLYFSLPREKYTSKEEFTSTIEQASKSVLEDIYKIAPLKEKGLSLPLLEVPCYLFSIGLGTLTVDDLFKEVQNLNKSDISDGLAIFTTSNCHVSTEYDNLQIPAKDQK